MDYWASALGLRGGIPERHVREGLVDPALFRVGLDRPDLEIPRARYYVALFLIGPLLIPFRTFRRLGRYRIRFRKELGRDVLERLRRYRLGLEERGAGRVAVRRDRETLAEDVLDPRGIAGFSSLFFAAYKIPLASLTTILALGLLVPALHAGDRLTGLLPYAIPVGFPLFALLLYGVYRDAVTALLGAFPVVVARYLLVHLRPAGDESWVPFLLALSGLFVLYLVAEWLFMPRPVPPVLFFYQANGRVAPYEREGDAPYWLEGSVYWVWRYMMLTPAELNKFWERDWERVELWIRADGPDAGALEWVVTDAHYRELWVPFERLGERRRLERNRAEAVRHAREGRPGTWLVEVDADLLFHTPFVRSVSFLPEEGDVPVLGLGHLAASLRRRGARERVAPYLRKLDRLRVERGHGLFDDVPEAAATWATRQILSRPWRYWRYPLGAQRRREERVYEKDGKEPPPPASDPSLQIKAPEADPPSAGEKRGLPPGGRS